MNLEEILNFKNKLKNIINILNTNNNINMYICYRKPFGTIYFNNNTKYIVDCTKDNYMLYELSDYLVKHFELNWKKYKGDMNYITYMGQFSSTIKLLKICDKLNKNTL